MGNCDLCGEEGAKTLSSLELSSVIIYGKVPMNHITKKFYDKGYKPATMVCVKCLKK